MIGFVYIWFDRKRRMYYIGSHVGREDDGYVCGSRRMFAAYRKRPEDFRRRIIERIYTNKIDVLVAEDRWLKLIKSTELSVRYYNMKPTATGWPREAGLKGGRVMGDRTKGKPRPRAAVEKTAAAHRGMKRSAESRARMSEAQRKSPLNAMSIAASANKRRGKPISLEHKRATSIGLRASTKHAAQLKRLHERMQNFKHTPESIAKMSAAKRAYWERWREARGRT